VCVCVCVCVCVRVRGRVSAQWQNQWLESPFPNMTSMFLCKVESILVQAWTGPEGSSRLRLPDSRTIGA
jgi:hypothetical protein